MPFPNARPTVYRGIEMRSRLEASYAAMFDEFGLTWEHEPRAYADGPLQYLPDFELRAANRSIFVEVKGTCDFAFETTRMSVVLASDPSAALALCVGSPIESPGEAWVRWEQLSPDGLVNGWANIRDPWTATVGLARAWEKWTAEGRLGADSA